MRRISPITALYLAKSRRTAPQVTTVPATDPAPIGWSYIYHANVLSLANDGSPYITDGQVTISLDAFLMGDYFLPPFGFEFVTDNSALYLTNNSGTFMVVPSNG